MRLSLLAVLAPGLLAAQMRLSGPVSGLLYNPQSRAVQPVVGVPGAAYLGAPILSGLEGAVIAPDGMSALAVREGEVYLVRGLKEAEPSWAPLDAGPPVLAAWSSNGAAVAVHSGGSGVVTLFRGPEERTEWPAPPGVVRSLAMDSSGHVLAAVESEEAGGLYLLAAGAPGRLLVRIDRPAGIALGNGERDALIADAARSQVWWVRDFATTGEVALFAIAAGARSELAGLAVSRDGRKLIVADRGERALAVYELATQALVAQLSLDFSPSGIEALGAGMLHLVKHGGPQPFYVFSESPQPGVYFIPASGPVMAEEQQ